MRHFAFLQPLRWHHACAALCCALPLLVQAEVADVTAQGFLIKHSVHVNVPPAQAYEVLTAQVGQWWTAATPTRATPAT